METRLRPVNALIGLVTPGDMNSPALADAGFHLVGLEVPVAGPRGAVVVDVLLLHEESAHLLLCECKSGANAQQDQAARYAAVDPGAVVQAGHVTLPHRVAPTTEVVYACLGEHLTRIRQGLQEAGSQFPIVAVHPDRITFEGAGAASDQLRAAFAAGPILLQNPPGRFIAFDHDSPVQVLAPYVKAQLIAELSHRTPGITIRGLTERTTPHFGLYGRKARGNLCKRFAEAVREIVKAEPATFAYDPPTANRDGMVRLLRTPEDNDTRGRTQVYQALTGRAHTDRQKAGRSDPNQLDLLRELDQADDAHDEGGSQDEEETR